MTPLACSIRKNNSPFPINHSRYSGNTFRHREKPAILNSNTSSTTGIATVDEWIAAVAAMTKGGDAVVIPGWLT